MRDNQMRPPLWKGPEEDGITFSMLSRFLVCRERFRIAYVKGLRPVDQFNHKVEYGQMWHVCEESLAKGNDPTRGNKADRATPLWEGKLSSYCRELARKYHDARDQIIHWYNVCRVQFAAYVEYWRRHPDVMERVPLLQEKVFDVPYKLPSGRVVRLRGKWDSVDLIGRGDKARVYLQENKTKSDVNELKIKRQLSFDLQTMMYMVALREYRWNESVTTGVPRNPVLAGVRYNVVRRPLSGGKGTIVRHKPTKKNPSGESAADFYGRLAGIISDSPSDFFARWEVEVTPGDIAKFRRECLDPILEQLCDWWQWVSFITTHSPTNLWDNDVSFGGRPDADDNGSHASAIHWRHPFGVYNVLDEGGSSDLDEYLATGSDVGLRRVETLFEELV